MLCCLQISFLILIFFYLIWWQPVKLFDSKHLLEIYIPYKISRIRYFLFASLDSSTDWFLRARSMFELDLLFLLTMSTLCWVIMLSSWEIFSTAISYWDLSSSITFSFFSIEVWTFSWSWFIFFSKSFWAALKLRSFSRRALLWLTVCWFNSVLRFVFSSVRLSRLSANSFLHKKF